MTKVAETKLVKVDDIEPNTWNPNKQSDLIFEKERASIREFGFIDPVTVRTHPKKKGKFEIVDGEHRWRAAKEEGIAEIPVIDLGKITNARAKALTDIMNNMRGEQDPVRRASLLKTLLDEDASLARLLPYGEDELQSLLEAGDFDWSGLSEDGTRPKKGDDGDGESGWVGIKVSLTPKQHKVVANALALAKKKANTDSDAEALTTICKFFPKQ